MIAKRILSTLGIVATVGGITGLSTEPAHGAEPPPPENYGCVNGLCSDGFSCDIDEDCADDEEDIVPVPQPLRMSGIPYWVHGQWVLLANIDADEVADRLDDPALNPTDYEDGWGEIKTDFFGVIVSLPRGETPEKIITDHLNNPSTLGNGTFASEWVSWPVAGPSGHKDGDAADLDIVGPDNGQVIFIDTDPSDGQVCVITAENETSGTHPVDGVRCWGFVEMEDDSWLIYTIGVEAAGVAGTGLPAAIMQHGTWISWVTDVGWEVDDRGGTVDKILVDTEWTGRMDGAPTPGNATRDNIDHPGEIDNITSWEQQVFWETLWGRAPGDR